ncbi:MAG: Beta-galactosidase precursor [Planctomycetes bacterium ADurb.Bin126]|nr:MAG: Beta-galactosidase precursor [Planctomycetes bacterium ADurb.Bin126]HOD80075.1 DUF5597 domain-containing protein [Phycisphaerae bacterium]
MRSTAIAFIALAAVSVPPAAWAQQTPHLRKKGTATQLVVDGKAMVLLAGELHNSSASGAEYMAKAWPRLQALNLNAVLAPVSWELVEPEEGKFDFSSVDMLIEQAREHEMKLGLLWFGSWKNGVSSYCPAWVKRDTRRFPRALGSSNRNTKDVLTPLSDSNLQADAKAFASLMRHLRQVDGKQHTVVLVQVENEVGIKPELRDLSELGDRMFAADVPAELTSYLAARKDALVPELKAHWQKAGSRTAGTWQEVFGPGPQADEIFSAWHYARYIHQVARAGKAEYSLPMYANAWLRGDGKWGTYPSGGPLAHVMDVWRAAGTDIDFLAPDIYLSDFKGICEEYTQQGNPLMIPEASADEQAAARAFWAVAEHDAICFAPFGIDRMAGDHPLGDAYAVLGQLLPLITAAHGSDRMVGIYQQDRSQEQPSKPIMVGSWRANIRYAKRGPLPAYGLIIQSDQEEFIVAGNGFDVNFSPTAKGPRNCGILSVELGRFEQGKWVCQMRLNGDETGANYRARLPVNPANPHYEPNRPKILKVRVYRYD